jgi:ComF family protein
MYKISFIKARCSALKPPANMFGVQHRRNVSTLSRRTAQICDGRCKGRTCHNLSVSFIDFLAPRSCVFCGTLCETGESSICGACFLDLPWNEPAVSPTPGVFDCLIAMLHYEYPVDVAIKAFKFRRRLFYAPAFSEVLCSARDLLPDGIDALLPVPLHWRREAYRGFNQATELAKPLAKLLALPMLRGIRRCKATPFQSGLAAADRTHNLRRAFRATRTITHSHILIVDDVLTTGATVRAVSKVLRASGVSEVSVLTVARAG